MKKEAPNARKHQMHQNFGITLNTGTEIIEPVSKERLLGGTVSSNVKWTCHIMNSQTSVTADILLIWTSVPRTNVAFTNVVVTGQL